jgi:hypothetical protein
MKGHPEMASELQDVQRAGGEVLKESEAAHERGELSDAVVLGFRLVVVSLMMKPAYRPAALKIAKEYAQAVGIDYAALEEQIQARIYQHVQIACLEADISSPERGSSESA